MDPESSQKQILLLGGRESLHEGYLQASGLKNSSEDSGVMNGAHICPEVPLIMLHCSECQKLICRKTGQDIAMRDSQRLHPIRALVQTLLYLNGEQAVWPEHPAQLPAPHSGTRTDSIVGDSVKSSVQ